MPRGRAPRGAAAPSAHSTAQKSPHHQRSRRSTNAAHRAGPGEKDIPPQGSAATTPRGRRGRHPQKDPAPNCSTGTYRPGARTPGNPATSPSNPPGTATKAAEATHDNHPRNHRTSPQTRPPNEATENSGHPEKTHPKNCPANNQQLPRQCPTTAPASPREHKFRKHNFHKTRNKTNYSKRRSERFLDVQKNRGKPTRKNTAAPPCTSHTTRASTAPRSPPGKRPGNRGAQRAQH